MVRKIVENDLTAETNVSEIIAIQKMKDMANDFFFKRQRKINVTNNWQVSLSIGKISENVNILEKL